MYLLIVNLEKEKIHSIRFASDSDAYKIGCDCGVKSVRTYIENRRLIFGNDLVKLQEIKKRLSMRRGYIDSRILNLEVMKDMLETTNNGILEYDSFN